MSLRIILAAVAATVTLVTAPGCAVTRGQEHVGAYVEDSAITANIKTRFAADTDVDATSIRVETLHGTVMLSGFAKSLNEKENAEKLAWKVDGVHAVKNEIAVRQP
jgi:hyperosmotically inducible protein